MLKRTVFSCLLIVGLAACDSDENLVSQVVSLLGATSEHPCFGEFEYQFELNGNPADTRSSRQEVDGQTVVTDEHWYPASQMINYFRYAEGAEWCEPWSETGVSW